MTYLPPNPFLSYSAVQPPVQADTAVAAIAPGSVAAAGPITARRRFVLDEAAFWEKMLGTIPPDVRWDG